MRVPVSWLVEPVELPEVVTDPARADEIAEALIRVGFEVEDVERLETPTGPLVVGRVLEITELTEFKKPIRFCRVDVGPEHNDPAADGPADGPAGDVPASRGIVCGATNFAVDDLVVAALPGTTLPGGFAIAARKTYGHVSDGMLCALDELGLGEDHAGILVLPPSTATPGDDAVALLGLDDTVLDVAVNPDRGYALSVRGLARELACAFDAPYGDPALTPRDLPAAAGPGPEVRLDPASGCRRFVARRVTGLDPAAPTPWWLHRRLLLAGIRPISLAVDVTNYVMLELGQPMHAYDASAVRGVVVVRRAGGGEKLTTLDDVQRALDPDDVVVTDDSGPIGLAGVMGGAGTEVGPATTDVLLEAATWDAPSVARAARRHKLPSEAARRFEREVDPGVARAAADRAAWLLAHYGGAAVDPAVTDAGDPAAWSQLAAVDLPLDLPDRVAGVRYAPGAVVRRLVQVGCDVEVAAAGAGPAAAEGGGAGTVRVVPPTWRPDLTRPADLVEEVLRLEGYDTIPSRLPAAVPGTGLTVAQRRRRQVSRALADAGYQEVLPSPFVAPGVWDAFGLDADDPRRRAVRLANPLDADRALLATTLLPGLLDAVVRNVSRGLRDLALFHVGQVVRPDRPAPAVTQPGVGSRPSVPEIAALLDALPAQPQRVGAVLTGAWERPGWWGPGRAAGWADAVDAARVVAGVYGATLRVEADRHAPWHPGRCAALWVDAPDGPVLVGHAGELHPTVCETMGLPPRTCAAEVELDRLPLGEVLPAPAVSSFPPVLLDVALVADATVPVAAVAEALVDGGGELVEDVRLFDVYTGPQVGEGRRSLAFALRMRASDRTLTVEEAARHRDAAVATAAERTGAVLRG